jgi:hypothetical protein
MPPTEVLPGITTRYIGKCSTENRNHAVREMLQKERQARELAEELAKRLELQSESRTNGDSENKGEGFIIEEAFEPPLHPI